MCKFYYELPRVVRQISYTCFKSFKFSPRTTYLAIKSFLIGNQSDETLIENIKAATKEVSAKAFNMHLREITDTNVSEQYEKKELPILQLQAKHGRLVSSSSLKLIKLFNSSVQSHVFEAPQMLLQVEPKNKADVINKFVQPDIQS